MLAKDNQIKQLKGELGEAATDSTLGSPDEILRLKLSR